MRLANTVSSQVRRRNTFCISWIDLLHRPGARDTGRSSGACGRRAAVVGHAREARRLRRRGAVGGAGDLQVRVALVVAEQDVEARVQRLDQVVLEQQRLGLGAHHRRLQARDARHHVADARAAVVLVEVARDALLQVARLADVEHARRARRSSGRRRAGRAAPPPRPAGARAAPASAVAVAAGIGGVAHRATILPPSIIAGMHTPLRWDLFCRVIDNFGDIGVCWRLAADLAARGERCACGSTMPRALAWMAPHGAPGVRGAALDRRAPTGPSPATWWSRPSAATCRPPSSRAWRGASRPPVWINLEYLSAEAYVERSHGLPSPQLSGPGARPAQVVLLSRASRRHRRPAARAAA